MVERINCADTVNLFRYRSERTKSVAASEVKSIEIDWRRRVVWVNVDDKLKYFVPFEALGTVQYAEG